MDRVAVFEKKRVRTLPSFIGWDYKELNERQEREISAGGFGGGQLVPPLDLVRGRVDEEELNGQHNIANAGDVSTESKASLLVSKLQLLARTRDEIIAIMNDANSTDLDDATFVSTVEDAKRELGIECPTTPPAFTTEPLAENGDTHFWDQVINVSNKVETEFTSKKSGTFFDDIPSFDLGITQDGVNIQSEAGDEKRLSTPIIFTDTPKVSTRD